MHVKFLVFWGIYTFHLIKIQPSIRNYVVPGILFKRDKFNFNIDHHDHCIMLLSALALWGCVPELTKNCVDMTNASSMYVSLGLGAIIGAVISWWIYNVQKQTSMKQDETLRRINELEESHDRVLKSIQYFQQHQEKLLNKILSLDKKIDTIVDTDKKNKWS